MEASLPVGEGSERKKPTGEEMWSYHSLQDTNPIYKPNLED